MSGTVISALVSSTVIVGGSTANYGARLTITNTGTVSPGSNGAYGVIAGGGVVNIGVVMGGSAAGGTYAGAGVVIENGAGFYNLGLVEGGANVGVGVYLQSGYLENSGAILGTGADAGVVVATGPGNIAYNFATITGGAANGTYGAGIVIEGAGTLVNEGTLIGGGNGQGDAAVLGLGATLEVKPGASFVGDVVAQNGEFILLSEGAESNSFSGLGSILQGFTTIDFQFAGSWTLEGNINGLAAGQTIDGFEPGDTLVLDGFAATAHSYVSGTGLVLSNATASETLAFAGSFGVNQFIVTDNANGGTGISLFNYGVTINTDITHAVQVGYEGAPYVGPLTITSQGTVDPATSPLGYAVENSNTVVNAGVIIAPPASGSAYFPRSGVFDAGYLLNQGYIGGGAAGGVGVYLFATSASIVNSGTIAGTGTYAAVSGLYTEQGPTTVVNSGLIEATGLAVGLGPGDALIDSGTIIGGSLAISVSQLIVEQGAEITGGISATTIDFEAGSGTLSGLDSWRTISLAPGADWTIIDTYSSEITGGSIVGFGLGDTLEIEGFSETSTKVVKTTPDRVTLTGTIADGTTTRIILNFNPPISDLYISADGLGDTLIVACFYPGTRLTTPTGEVAVEDIQPGTLLLTNDGLAVPVRWLGRSTISTRFADPLRVLPIRIKAGALGEKLPARDLLVSPDHAMFIDGLLLQAGALVNGATIFREARVPEVFTYFHVELATHALLLAEGAAAESFVDNVNEMGFDNWAEHAALAEAAPIAEMPYPRAKAHRQVPVHIRKMLELRAAQFFAADANIAA